MKWSRRYIVLVACLAVVLCIALFGKKGPTPIGLTMLGWTTSNTLGDTNAYAMIQITNRTARAQGITIYVRALNASGSWDPVPEKLVLQSGVANVVFVLPARSGTNISVKWLPLWGGNNWRVHSEYDPVASRLESRFIHWANRLRLVYPFLRGGQIPPQEIGAPKWLVQQTGASHPIQETNRVSGAAGFHR